MARAPEPLPETLPEPVPEAGELTAPEEPQPGPPDEGDAETAAEPAAIDEAPAVEVEESPEDIWQGEGQETPDGETGARPEPSETAEPEEPDEQAGPTGAADPDGDTPPATEASTPEEPPPPEEKSAGDVRKELQDYLAKVKDKLEKDRRDAERAQQPEKLKAPGLLDYLGKLADHLPNGVKSQFQESDERLRMEVLKSKLFGRRGLRKKAETRDPVAGSAPPPRLTRSKIADTFGYMKDLAVFIRDGGMRKNMMTKLESLVGKLRGRKDG